MNFVSLFASTHTLQERNAASRQTETILLSNGPKNAYRNITLFLPTAGAYNPAPCGIGQVRVLQKEKFSFLVCFTPAAVIKRSFTCHVPK